TPSRASPPPVSPAATSCDTPWWRASWMPTRRPAIMSRKAATDNPRLALSVQYALDAPDLPRWRVRRWVQQAVNAAAAAGALPGVATVALALRLVDSEEAQSLNRDFRGRDY